MKSIFTRLAPAITLSIASVLLSQCSNSTGPGNMGGPTPEARNLEIARETPGDYYVGRRYFVKKTRFWGFLRRPGQPWKTAKLVIFRENAKHAPDRFSENGPANARYAMDQNAEYKINGNYTGKTVYEPNSNQFLPEFQLTGYQLISRDRGWIFRPDDRYNDSQITIAPR